MRRLRHAMSSLSTSSSGSSFLACLSSMGLKAKLLRVSPGAISPCSWPCASLSMPTFFGQSTSCFSKRNTLVHHCEYRNLLSRQFRTLPAQCAFRLLGAYCRKPRSQASRRHDAAFLFQRFHFVNVCRGCLARHQPAQ